MVPYGNKKFLNDVYFKNHCVLLKIFFQIVWEPHIKWLNVLF